MSKRKLKTATKRAPKRAAQRAKQTVVRSPKPRSLLSVAAERDEDVEPEAHIVADTAIALVAGPATALQHASKQTMINPKQEFAFSSTTADVRAYQAKLLELTQANLQFAFEFAAKLAAVRSPIDLFNVMVEFTNKRIVMFQNFSMRNG